MLAKKVERVMKSSVYKALTAETLSINTFLFIEDFSDVFVVHDL